MYQTKQQNKAYSLIANVATKSTREQIITIFDRYQLSVISSEKSAKLSNFHPKLMGTDRLKLF